MPVASTSCGEIEMLALYKGLVQATPSTRTLELRVGDITISSVPAQHMRSKVAAKPPASTSAREPPGRAATSSSQRRACNRAAASAGQPPPFPKGATANPNSDQKLHQAPALIERRPRRRHEPPRGRVAADAAQPTRAPAL